MPVRNKRNRRRQLSPMAVRWLLGEHNFLGLIPHSGLPFDEDELRDFWHEHREWALTEAKRLGLPVPPWEEKYARSQER